MSGSLATLLIAMALMTGAQAKEYEDVTSETTYAEQIEILSDIGVIKGTGDTTFSPDEMVTREQMSLLLFRLMLGKDTAGRVNTSSFTDLTDDTYFGAISWANASGFIIGTGDNTFSPTAGITLQDAMTMLIRALGHGTAQMNAGYPWTYIDAAVKLGLDDGLESLSYTKELTRAEASAILYNALTAEYLIPKTASNGMTFFESTTIIERVFGYEIEESVLVATNDYALEGVATVTRDGYVTLHTDDGFITVKYSDLGLAGDADAHLGKNLKLVFKRDDKTKLITVLGASELSKTVAAETITVGDEDKYVEIGGVKYQVVKELSDHLATNENELLVYAYGSGDKLIQIETNAELSALLGAFDATLIFDDKDSETADRLIIKPYSYGKLQITSGKVNLAESMKEEDLTIVNPGAAVSGDHVLYFFNKDNKTLEIAAKLTVTESATVTRLTATTATIGSEKYTLGSEKLGIPASSLYEKLSVGDSVKVVVYGDMILAVESAEVVANAPSKYLIAASSTTPVFSGGKFGYVMEAVIDGVTETLFVTNSSVTVGDVYRYVETSTGAHTLIPMSIADDTIASGEDKFVQSDDHNDEIAFHIAVTDSTEIVKGSSYSTVVAGAAEAASSLGAKSEIKFVTDDSSVIIIKSDGKYTVIKGAPTSGITVSDGAALTAIFHNEIGSVETLRFMFISDGDAGHTDTTEAGVKILEKSGQELVDGKVYTLYTVLNFATGEVETMHSKSASLEVGKNYLTTVDGFISESETDVTSGVLTGYTGKTVTVGGDTYKLATGVKFSRLGADNTVTAATVKELLMSKVELVMKDGEVVSVICVGEVEFDVAYESGTVTVSTDETLPETAVLEVTLLTVFDEERETFVPTHDYELSAVPSEAEGFAYDITATPALQAGKYTLQFTVNGVAFEAEFTVTAEVEAE